MMAGEITELPDLSDINARTPDLLVAALKPFSSSNKSSFDFGKLSVLVRREFTDQLLDIINDLVGLPQHEEAMEECLTALVIMSRDSASVQGVFNTKRSWDNLTLLAGLRSFNEGKAISDCYDNFHDIAILCHKCLSNLLYLTADANGFCNNAEFLEKILTKLSTLTHESSDEESLLLRLVFLTTAFNHDARLTIVSQFNGRKVLIDLLTLKLSKCDSLDAKTKSSIMRSSLPECYAKVTCTIFKTLFNINMRLQHTELSEKHCKEFDSIILTSRKLITTVIQNNDGLTHSLHVDVQNCLCSIASSYFNDKIFAPFLRDVPDEGVFSYSGSDLPTMEDRDLSAVQAILMQLENKVEDPSAEYLMPVLTLLIVLSRSSRIIRKYCKKYIIPPRKDFVNRPETGSKLRNKLIRLFTHANSGVKDAAAEFIFVLCKESVQRLVKHTGYGNAAGLLASRGLLAGGKGDTVYSDTDTDSDTEEYRESVDKVNPITGHIPPEMPDPMKDMSDEQKEYLAVQLANDLAKLSNDQVIQPVCVDPNSGKLVSIQQKFHETVLPEEKDSDDDDGN